PPARRAAAEPAPPRAVRLAARQPQALPVAGAAGAPRRAGERGRPGRALAPLRHAGRGAGRLLPAGARRPPRRPLAGAAAPADSHLLPPGERVDPPRLGPLRPRRAAGRMDAVGAVTAGLGEAVKAAGRRALASICHRSGVALGRLRGRAVILGYHRVLAPGDLGREFVQPGMYVEAGEFAAHVRYLLRHFRVLALEDLLARWAAGDWDPAARYCAITFDDGWRDNYVHAFPVLRALGVPATIFVATAFVGTPERFWTDILAACLRA